MASYGLHGPLDGGATVMVRPYVVEAEREQARQSRRRLALVLAADFGSAAIDSRTTVHALGRTARLLLDAGDEERAWRGTAARLGVLERATHPDPRERFAGVREFADAWLRAAGA
ncbi:hypothetical protein [Streptomyces bottropensis]